MLASRCVLLQLGDISATTQRSPVGVNDVLSGVISVSSGGVTSDSVRYSLIVCFAVETRVCRAVACFGLDCGLRC